MKVSELPYERYTIERVRDTAEEVFADRRAAHCHNCMLKARKKYLAMMEEFETASAIAYCRYSLDTRDPFYSMEQDYYDEIMPEIHLIAAMLLICIAVSSIPIIAAANREIGRVLK